MTARAASHAGTWYTAARPALAAQLADWTAVAAGAASSSANTPRAIVAPHAGYAYSGPTAAYAYAAIDPLAINRIFILGPSHHVHIRGCALTQCTEYVTPLGNLTVDTTIVNQLKATGKFEIMTIQTDEDEHSIEMHLPYVFHAMSSKKDPYTIIPILVGAISANQERMYGELLAPYLSDPSTLFIISSDFCHWGSRFNYTYRIDPSLSIHESIEKLDRMGMDAIETKTPSVFHKYLNQTHNTICGRHPIAVLLYALDALANGHVSPPSTSPLTNSNSTDAIVNHQSSPVSPNNRAGSNTAKSGGMVASTPPPAINIKFIKYAQSSQVTNPKESSVSYASAIIDIA